MYKAFLVGALSLAIVSSCASSSQNIREKKADILFDAGTDSLSRGEYSDALGALQEAHKLEPESVKILNNLGLAFAAKEEYKRAEDTWKRALKIESGSTDSRANLGALYLRTKRYKEAETQLKIALNDLTYSNSAQVHFNLAKVYENTGRAIPAETQLKLATKSNENYCPAWFRLGKIQKQRGELEKASESFSKSVLGTCFNNPEAHFEIGTIQLKTKNVVGARSKLLEVINFFPDSEWAQKAEETLSMIR